MLNPGQKKVKRIGGSLVTLLGIPALIGAGIWLFRDRQYIAVSLAAALLSCLPFFLRFEKGKHGARELTVIAVMTALSVLGRTAFYALPGFKPVTAIVVITGIAFGCEAGFLTGSLSAVISNMLFGQGPWTPFQMFIWGIIGLFSGLLFFRRKRPGKVILIIVGAVSGVLFSLMMDIWTTLSATGAFTWRAYVLNVVSSVEFMAVYAGSNAVFLLLLTNPLLDKLDRLKIKYGIFP